MPSKSKPTRQQLPPPLSPSSRYVRDQRNPSFVSLSAGELLRRNVLHILRTKGYRTFELFAHEEGFSKSTLSQLVSQRRDPRLSTLEELAKALAIPLHRLFEPPFPLPPDWDEL